MKKFICLSISFFICGNREEPREESSISICCRTIVSSSGLGYIPVDSLVFLTQLFTALSVRIRSISLRSRMSPVIFTNSISVRSFTISFAYPFCMSLVSPWCIRCLKCSYTLFSTIRLSEICVADVEGATVCPVPWAVIPTSWSISS